MAVAAQMRLTKVPNNMAFYLELVGNVAGIANSAKLIYLCCIVTEPSVNFKIDK
jgi:hypothetical protein